MATKRDQAVSYLTQQLQLAWKEADHLRIQIGNMRDDNRKQVEIIAKLKDEISRLEALTKPAPQSKVAKIKSRKRTNGRRLKIKNRYKVDGTELRKLMKRDSIDAKTLAGVLDVSIGTIQNWLKGKSTTMDKINGMADCFQVDVSVLTKKR